MFLMKDLKKNNMIFYRFGEIPKNEKSYRILY